MTKQIVEMVWGLDVKPIGTVDGLGVNVQLTSEDGDTIRQVVGRGGASIAAIRRLMHVWGIRNRTRVNVFAMPEDESKLKPTD